MSLELGFFSFPTPLKIMKHFVKHVFFYLCFPQHCLILLNVYGIPVFKRWLFSGMTICTWPLVKIPYVEMDTIGFIIDMKKNMTAKPVSQIKDRPIFIFE